MHELTTPVSHRRLAGVAVVVAVLALVGAACVPPPPPPPVFTWTVDAEVRPLTASLPGGPAGEKVLAAVRDAQGVESSFVTNEVVIRPRHDGELDAFLARTGGVVVADDSVPLEALDPGDEVDEELLEPTQFTVRLDPGGLDARNLARDMRAMGLVDASRISSTEGAGLLALVAAEQRAGIDVVPDFVSQGGWLESTTEGTPPFGPTLDAMTEGHWSHNGSRSHVAAAWQWVGERTTVRRVKVAIIDGGFWLDEQGYPYVTELGTDIFGRPRQWDVVDNDANAGGPNPNTCTNDRPCPWHGNNTAGAAVGLVDNAGGASGSGGTVADPILLKKDGSTSTVNRAVRVAVGMGADVINMSFGRSCNFWCRTFAADFELGDATGRGVAIVAGAGNLDEDSGAENVQPCNMAGVICVGALKSGETTKISYSNFGAPVDLFAPTNIRTMPTPSFDTRWDECTAAPQSCFSTAGGTSAAAPVVAGVAAMMKAVNPSLDGFTIEQMLRDSAFTDSPTPVVTRYLNALGAVRLAGGQSLRADVHEPDDSVTGLPLRVQGTFADLTIGSPADMDHVRFRAGRSHVDLRYRYPGALGRVDGEVVRGTTSQCGEIEVVGSSTGSGNTRRTFAVPPGEYLSRTTGRDGNTLPYDLTVTATTKNLPTDPHEPNNSLGQARPIPAGHGERSASFTWSGDQDWYRVQSTGGLFAPLVGGTQFKVAITATDVPLRLEVYDAAGELHDSRQTTATCGNLPNLTLPEGTFYLQVRSLADSGTYRFTVQQTYTQGRLYDQRGVFAILLDPSIPVQYSLRTDSLRVGFIATPGVLGSTGIRVQSVDTYNRILDGDGNVVAEGTPSDGGDVFDPGLLEPGEAYLLETERVDGDEDPGHAVPVTVSLEAGERTVTAGDEHSCAVVQGKVSCWGNDAAGQLGDGPNLGGDRYAAVPVAVDTAAPAAEVAAGQDFTCALLVTGTVQCWGANYAGQLGQGAPGAGTSQPVAVPGLEGVLGLAAGSRHVCALRHDGTVWCWGANPDGRLGRDTGFAPSGVPGPVDLLDGVTSIAAGGAHSCAVNAEGVWCWGYNEYHQLGDDEVISSIGAIPVDGTEGAHGVTAGSSHTCAVTVDGAVSCWGLGEDGQLGTDTFRSAEPLEVPLGGPVHTVSAGSRHTCAAGAEEVRCWGANDRLQLGGGDPEETSTTPVPVPEVAGPLVLAVGGDHACVVEAAALRCWGANSHGGIGDGTSSFSVVVPSALEGLPTDAVEVTAGMGHSCALPDDDTVWCWGRNWDGELGDGAEVAGPARHTPAPVADLGPARSVAAGGLSTCAVLTDGTVWCWGANPDGQLGGGSVGGSSSLPLQVLVAPGQPLTGAASVAVGPNHACARTEEGRAWCWGRGGQGQLGDGVAFFGRRSAFAVGVFDAAGPMSDVAAVTAGADASCALRTDTTAVCWGTGWYGELGNGSTSAAYAAGPVVHDGAPLSGVSAVSLHTHHACAVLADGALTCWGANYSGQLGTGDVEDAATAVVVPGVGEVTGVAAGGEHTCVVLTWAGASGAASCVGFGHDGALGTMATADRWDHGLPVQDPSGVLAEFAAVAAGDTHTCGIRNGSVLCWGQNASAQVGMADTGMRAPRPVVGL